MIKKLTLSFTLILTIFATSSYASIIKVAVAANLQFTIEELGKAYQEASGNSIEPIIGSSGKLTTQIKNGAPFDLFMSADTNYPTRLYKEGLTTDKPVTYAFGKLVLWTTKSIDLKEGVKVLSQNNIKKIAIASPKLAPYGYQAVNVMKYYSLYPTISNKLVYGENIAQTNQFIVIGAVDAGFTAKSVVLADNMKNTGTWIDVPQESYEPIAQAFVVLKNSNNLNIAKDFAAFLSSEKAQQIFVKYGYDRP